MDRVDLPDFSVLPSALIRAPAVIRAGLAGGQFSPSSGVQGSFLPLPPAVKSLLVPGTCRGRGTSCQPGQLLGLRAGLDITREHERPGCSLCQTHVTYRRAQDHPGEWPLPRSAQGTSLRLLWPDAASEQWGAEGKEDKEWEGWQRVPPLMRSHRQGSVSPAHTGLINQPGLGDSETG